MDDAVQSGVIAPGTSDTGGDNVPDVCAVAKVLLIQDAGNIEEILEELPGKEDDLDWCLVCFDLGPVVIRAEIGYFEDGLESRDNGDSHVFFHRGGDGECRAGDGGFAEVEGSLDIG